MNEPLLTSNAPRISRRSRQKLIALHRPQVVLNRIGGHKGHFVTRLKEAARGFGWAFAATLVGIAIGISAAILPPTGIFSLVLAGFVFLLWAFPDVGNDSVGSLRYLLLAYIVVFLCIPAYWSLTFESLPVINAKRLVEFPLILIFAYKFAASSRLRAHFFAAAAAAKPIFIGAAGFLVMIIISAATSVNIAWTLSQALDATLSWFVPFFVAIVVLRQERDVELVVKLISVCAILVSILGIVEIFVERNLALEFMPKILLDNVMAHDPNIQIGLTDSDFRNGYYRAPSIFEDSLAFAEFASISASFGAFFIAYGRGVGEKILGCLVFVTSSLGIFASGARGGYISIFVGTVLMTGLMILRKHRLNPRSLLVPIALVVAFVFFSLAVALVFTSNRAHNFVLGGGMEAYSTQARYDQWDLALPKILANPLTGYGFGNAGQVVGYRELNGFVSLDSYLLSVVVDVGVPGLFFYLLLLGGACGTAVARSLMDASRRGAMNVAFAGALAGYLTYRLVLIQRDNSTLIFVLCGMVVASGSLRQKDPKPVPGGEPPKGAPRPRAGDGRPILAHGELRRL